MRRLIAILLWVYLFIYVFAVPMLLFDLVPTWGSWMGGFLNMLLGCLMALWLYANAGRRGLLAAGCIVGLAGAVEYIGVTTGAPFGRYVYSDALGLKLDGAVPLPIPFAWLLVVPGALGAAQLAGVPWRWLSSAAALLALLFDLLLEPFAVYIMDYWRWLDRGPYYGVPTANFIAWAVTGFVLAAITQALIGRSADRRTSAPEASPLIPTLLYLLNIVQFTLVDLVRGYTLAGLLGLLALLAGGLVLARNVDRASVMGRLSAVRLRATSSIETEQ
jgi:putative membrane protein